MWYSMLALVVGVVLLTTALLSSYVRYETVNGVRSTFLNNEGRQKDFEDSKIFNELMKEQALTIVRYGAIRGQLETDGVYDANKVIDITAYANRFERCTKPVYNGRLLFRGSDPLGQIWY